MGLSRVLPKAKDYPSLEHSGFRPRAGPQELREGGSGPPWRGSVPGGPRTPLVTFQKKVPRGGVKERAWFSGHSMGHGRLSPRSPWCPQPEVPGSSSHGGSSMAPRVRGHGHDCSEEVSAHGSRRWPAHHQGHPDISYPVAHVSDKLKRQHTH